MFFDRQLGLQEPLSGILRDGHDGDPLVHVAEIGIKPQLELARDLAFLLPKLSGERIEDRVLDLVIHIVEVDLFHALAQPIALGLQAGDRCIMIALHVRKILSKRISDPTEHGFRHGDTAEHSGELFDQHFLANIGLAALLLVVAASVIDVFLLLDVAHEQAAAMAAFDHPGKQEIPLDAADARRVAAVEHALDPFPELNRYQRLM